MALRYLVEKKEKTSAKEVSAALNLPFDATAKVMQIMASYGLLEANLGVAGGYIVVGNLANYTLLDLAKMLEGNVVFVKCADETTKCDLHESCNMVTPMKRLSMKLNDFFNSVSLAELVSVANDLPDDSKVEAQHVQ